MFTQLKDAYALLGSKESPTLNEHSRVFHAASMLHHPDRNPGNSEASAPFQRILCSKKGIERDIKKKQKLARSIAKKIAMKKQKEEADKASLRLGACGGNLSAYNLLNIADPDNDGTFPNFYSAFNAAKLAAPEDGNAFIAAWAEWYLRISHTRKAKSRGYSCVEDDGWNRGWMTLQAKWREPPEWVINLKTYELWALGIFYNQTRNESKVYKPLNNERKKQPSGGFSQKKAHQTYKVGSHPKRALGLHGQAEAITVYQNPSDKLLKAEYWPEIDYAISQMNEPTKTVMKMRLRGSSEEEIAAILGEPVSTVKSRITRATKQLLVTISA